MKLTFKSRVTYCTKRILFKTMSCKTCVFELIGVFHSRIYSETFPRDYLELVLNTTKDLLTGFFDRQKLSNSSTIIPMQLLEGVLTNSGSEYEIHFYD